MNMRILGGAVLVLVGTAMWSGASTWTGTPSSDAFVAAGSAGNPQGTDLTANNYGGAGTMAVSGTGALVGSTPKGTFESLLRFNTAAAKTQFDTQYGAGNWQITNISFVLSSNFGVQGAQPNNAIFNVINAGTFAIDWLSDDSWVEGTGSPAAPSATGVNFNSLSGLLSSTHEQLGGYTYTPPGNNVPLTYSLGLTNGFTSDAMAGGLVSFLFYATDDTGNYLFNSSKMIITAVPEPGSLPLLLGGVAALSLTWRRLRRA